MAWRAATVWLLMMTSLAGATALDVPSDQPAGHSFLVVPGIAAQVGYDPLPITYQGLTSEEIPADMPAEGMVTAQVGVSAAVAPLSAPAREWSTEEIVAYICSYPWPCEEALYVSGMESGLDPNVFNHQGSGACGLFQLLPCACLGVECNVGNAYAKWEDQDLIQDNGIGGFERHWYRFWR